MAQLKAGQVFAHGHTDLSVALRKTGIIAADFDGSIVPDHLKNYIEDPLVLKAAELVRGLGVTQCRFATVTGSRISRAKPWSDESGAPLFAENAGVLYDPRAPSGKLRLLIPQEEADFIIKQVAPKIEAFLDSEFPGYEKSDGKLTMATYHKPENVQMADFRDAVFGFVATLPFEVQDRLFTTYSHTLIDINHKGADKSRAIRFMSELFGIGIDRFTVYGDGDNDRPAFDAALAGNGTVIVPANHDKNVGEWLLGRAGDQRIVKHHLESTECLLDVLSGLRRN